MNKIKEFDIRFAKQLLVELARHNWLRLQYVEELKNSNTIFGIALDGEEYTTIVRATCLNSWTNVDENNAKNWADIDIKVELIEKRNNLTFTLGLPLERCPDQ